MGLKMADETTAVVNPAISPALTNWANEPQVPTLKLDLEAARPAHDTMVMKIDRWNNLNRVEGNARAPKVKGRSQVQPKLIRRQAEWRYSALSEPFNSSEDLFDVKPTTFEDADGARQNQMVLNWQFRTKINRVSFMDNYVRANVDEGTAIVRLGWNRITVDVEEEVPVWEYVTPSTAEEVQALQQAIEAKQENPRGFKEQATPEMQEAVSFYEENNQPVVVTQIGTEKIKTEKVIDNRPTLEIVNPKNFYWDPSCGDDLTKASFVIATFETCKADLQKEPKRYKNLEFVNWESASPVSESDHTPKSIDTNFNFSDEARKRIVAYEYWGLYDIQGDGVLVPIVATWIGNTLIRLEENPFPDGLPPFVVAPYMPVKRQLMGEPDAELLEDNQKILGAVTRGMIDLLGRSANAQQGFAKGMLDIVNRRRYENGQDYEFNPNMPPQNSIVEHKYPEIPQSAMLMIQLMNQESEALTGVKAFSGGLSGNAYGDVAAGIKGILDAASKREMAILRRLSAGLVLIGKKIIAMNQVFLSEEETVRVTNEQFVTVKREDLAGDYDLVVDISTPEVDAAKASDLAFMLQTMGPNMDFGITKLILIQIARLKRMPELVHQIEAFEPKPDPLVQKLRELEIEEKMKSIEKLQSEINLNNAKAQREATQAEQTALDTVETETGTKHARELEKSRAQATGNQDLEVTKALVKPKKQANGGESDPDIEAAVGWNALSKQVNDPRNTAINPIMGQ